MHKKLARPVQYITVVLLSVFILAQPLPAHAEEKAPSTLKISPVRTDLEIKPGDTRQIKLTVTNLANEAIDVRLSENDFVADDDKGTPAIILDETQSAPTHGLKQFMSSLKDVTIPAKQSKTVKVTISVPNDAKAGGYFGAVRFSPSSPDDGGQVNLSPSVASLILLTVPGNVSEQLDLTDFTVKQNGKTGTYFINSDGLELSSSFKNTGDIQLAPFGKISVTQGDKVVYETDFNSNTPRDMVLPGSSRQWSIPLSKVGGFGQYKVSATFTYGKQNKTVQVEQSFWVIPATLIIGILLGIVALIALVFFLRGYKNHILRSHGRSRRH